MSTGPGSVERVVAALFLKRDRAFTIAELSRRAFELRGNAKPTRAQRKSVERAAHRAMARANSAAGSPVIVCQRDGGGQIRFGRAPRDRIYSPPPLVEAARVLWGTIDCDPASCEEANEIVRATRYYSVNG